MCAALIVAATIACSTVAGAPPVASRDLASARKWHAPRECFFTPNPVRATAESLVAGQEIFDARCMGCHGATGAGDGPDAGRLRIRPARLRSARVQDQSDGLLWWKITLGRRPMPGYGFRLSSTDRWHVINYLRTLHE
ncbi:MAG: c-type cytochrome [Verrucomicrobiota bacterium]|nr:c-type cytochrome [Verrucomicrobiota bacterium]